MGIELIQEPYFSKKYQAVILATAHREFLELDMDSLKANNGVVFLIPKPAWSESWWMEGCKLYINSCKMYIL